MQQKTKGGASDPTTEHVKTEPCPEKGDDLPTPKRGAFPTPKAIIESAPQYIPESSEISVDSAGNQYAFGDRNQYVKTVPINMITHTLSDTTLILPMDGVILPATVTLKSSAPDRKIEVSTDGGEEYFSLAANKTSSTQLVVYIASPLSHLRVTGAANDRVILLS